MPGNIYGPFRVNTGQKLQLHTIASAILGVGAYARIKYDDGGEDLLWVSTVFVAATRVGEQFVSETAVRGPGDVVFAVVTPVTSGIKRGELWCRLSMEPSGAVLIQDYAHQDNSPSLGVYFPSGPGGGDGELELVTVKANTTPAPTSTLVLAASNTIRRYDSYVWYYNASSDVASRTMDVALRQPIGDLPTGFGTAANADVWRSLTTTLTADQEGTSFGRPGGLQHGENQNGLVTMDPAASPFPIWVREDDPSALIFSVGNEELADRDSIYLVRETWLVP